MKSDTMHNSKKDKKRQSAGHENTRGCFLLPYKKQSFFQVFCSFPVCYTEFHLRPGAPDGLWVFPTFFYIS